MPAKSAHDDSNVAQQSAQIDYYLPRNAAELIRLTAQHYVASMRIGYLLHPEIAEHISKISEPRIADAACGPGLWALHVAERYADSQVTALDVSNKLFPEVDLRPCNVEFGIVDLLDVHRTPQYLCKFDVVHVRLLLASARLAEPQQWLRGLQAMLKPGGYLQWEDTAYSGVSVVQLLPYGHPDPGGDHPFQTFDGRKYALADWEYSPTLFAVANGEEKLRWFVDFEKTATDVGGFVEISSHGSRPPIKPHLLHLEAQTGLGAFLTSTEMLLNDNNLTDTNLRAKLLKDKRALELALQNGKKVTYNFFVHIARRENPN